MHTHIEAWHRPRTLDEAHALLAQKGAMAVAGATEVGLRVGRKVTSLVDLGGLGLDRVWTDEEGMHFGAMVRATHLCRDAEVRAFVGDALPESAFAIASETIRNLTSIGGNVIHLTQWSDMPPALHALGARFRVQGTSDRWYTAEEMFAQPPRKLLQRGDLLTEILAPPRAPHTGSAFYKHAKTAVDFALVNLAAQVTVDGDRLTDVRLSVGAIHVPPLRLTAAEQALQGQALDEARLEEAAKAASEAVSPRRDARATEDYLRHCTAILVKRCVRRAAERAQEAA